MTRENTYTEIVKEGWLKMLDKNGFFSRWRDIYAVLERDKLAIYNDENIQKNILSINFEN